MAANSEVKNPSVVVIGAGMTGILLGIKLREAGITDLTILEKAAKVGGTWRENTYPGLADFHRGPLPQPVPANPLEEAA